MSDYVISTRIQRVKLQQSTLEIKHDIRTRIPKEYDLRRQNTHKNKMLDTSEEYSVMTEKDEETIKTNRNHMIEKAKEDYKKHKGKSIPSNTTFMISGIVTFGVSDEKKKQRDKDLKDLDEVTEDEARDINDFDVEKKDRAIEEYMRNLEKKYGTKVLYCVRHSDEKVDHYQFQMLNYDFENHRTMLSGMSKKDLAKLGTDLQDMCANAFTTHTDGYFGRGKKREKKKKHKSLKDMHDAELNEQKIKIERQEEKIKEVQREVESVNVKNIKYSNKFVDRNTIFFEKTIEVPADLLLIRKKDLSKIQKLKNVLKKNDANSIQELNEKIQKKDYEIDFLRNEMQDMKNEHIQNVKQIKQQVINEMKQRNTMIERLQKENDSLKNVVQNLKTEIQSITKDFTNQIQNIYVNLKRKFNISRNDLEENNNTKMEIK